MRKTNWQNLSKSGPQTPEEAVKWQLDKQSALAIYNLRHSKTITQRDIQAQIAALPTDQQGYFCQRLNHHELPEFK